MTEPPVSVELTASDVAGMCRAFGVTASAMSPLAFADGAEATGADALATRGLNAPEWRRAFGILSAPNTEIVSSLIETTRPLSVRCYGSGVDAGVLVGCWANGEGLTVSTPWSPKRVAMLAGMTLLASPPPMSHPTSVRLTPASLLALCACVDAVRRNVLDSMLHRQGGEPLIFETSEVFEQVERGLGEPDVRWVVPLMATLAPAEIALAGQDVAAGFQGLVRDEVVIYDGERWAPGELIMRLAGDWHTPVPAAAHAVATADGETVRSIRHRVTVRGDGPLWVLDFGGLLEGEPTITLRTAEPTAYLDELFEFLTPDAAPLDRFCRSCGERLRTNTRFCTSCGAGAPEPT